MFVVECVARGVFVCVWCVVFVLCVLVRVCYVACGLCLELHVYKFEDYCVYGHCVPHLVVCGCVWLCGVRACVRVW